MTTLEDLVQEVTLSLHGFTTRSEQITYLKTAVGTTETRLEVDDVDQVSRGVVEIGDELIRVESVDRGSNAAILAPRGRGWRGTTATAHAVGDTVTMSPLVPRVQIKRAINDTIGAIYPALFGVAETTFTLDDPLQFAWGVPAEAEAILDVRWLDLYDNWDRVRHWELENRVATGSFPTGKALRIRGVLPGRQIQVVYATRPVRMTDVSTFADTGLDDSVRELIVLGAQARLIPSLDVARLSIKSVNADELDQPNQLGSAISVAGALRKQYTERLTEERQILQSRYPGRIHFTR